jgi:AGZA family xanthine/uracil permease-like MFS transporter
MATKPAPTSLSSVASRAFIGLQKSEGLGLITYDGATLVTIGGCPYQDRSYMYTMDPNAAYWHDLCWNVSSPSLL